MAVPTVITDLSATAASNSPTGNESIGTNLDDYLRAGFAFDRQLYNAIYSNPLVGMKNKLIGGHFDSNPWQRGTSFTVTSSGTYVADRWRIDFDGTANISVAKVTLATPQVINGVFCRYGMKLTVNSKSGNTYMRMSQRIEGADILTTLAATLQTAVQGSGSFSVPVNARQSFGTGGSPSADVVTAFTASLAVTSSMQQLNTGLTVPDISSKTLGSAGNDFLGVEYDLTNIPVGGYIVVALAGFEYGSTATAWEDRRRIETVLCQRYWEPVTNRLVQVLDGTALTRFTLPSPFLVEKRANPTTAITSITSYNGSAFTVSTNPTFNAKGGFVNQGTTTTNLSQSVTPIASATFDAEL